MCRRCHSAHEAYSGSKLAQVMFTYHLCEELESSGAPVTVNAVDPGVVNTGLYSHLCCLTRYAHKLIAHFLFKVRFQQHIPLQTHFNHPNEICLFHKRWDFYFIIFLSLFLFTDMFLTCFMRLLHVSISEFIMIQWPQNLHWLCWENMWVWSYTECSTELI